MNKPIIALSAIMLFAAGIVLAGRPALVKQTVCYDHDATTGICGQAFIITTPADELRGRIHRADSRRQVKAADLAYEAMSGRIVDDTTPACQIGEPCGNCLTTYRVIGGITGCDGICLDCVVRQSRRR